ncbi:SCP2 sterol-binding domain-containing protein [Marinobacter lacisalsi]|uniref:SCP2 sterol-binding domain-containing protein n=1 Tax=Marinobacter lacisalsi TaxID=475979 RepID=A0ABV8QEU6_9GAMM
MLENLTRSAAVRARRHYVQAMFRFMGHGLEAISQADRKVIEDVRVLPKGFIFQMMVLPSGPSLVLEHTGEGKLRYLGPDYDGKVDLSIRFKHMAHAFLVLSFQEKTTEAFANDRMVVDGDISLGVRMTRVLNRMEAIILPRLVASRAVKEYPDDLGLLEKLPGAIGVYRRVAFSMIRDLRKEALPI